MTPSELLEEVKRRFSPLLVTNPLKLNDYLMRSLRTYRDRAGVIRNIDTSESVLTRPANALEIVSASDYNGNYIECIESRVSDGIEHKVIWTLNLDVRYKGRFKAPYRITYLLDLAALDIEQDQLPRGIVSLLSDYLECLIDIENTSRVRMAGGTAEMPIDALRTDAELIDRKAQLEDLMQETAEIIPIMVVI